MRINQYESMLFLFESEVARFDVDIFVLSYYCVGVSYINANGCVNVAAIYVCRV